MSTPLRRRVDSPSSVRERVGHLRRCPLLGRSLRVRPCMSLGGDGGAMRVVITRQSSSPNSTPKQRHDAHTRVKRNSISVVAIVSILPTWQTIAGQRKWQFSSLCIRIEDPEIFRSTAVRKVSFFLVIRPSPRRFGCVPRDSIYIISALGPRLIDFQF